ncbi:MAG TPA: aminoglycoside phosphotransferase family protein [Chloroflexia bacterium]|nr:aminoglycoside phosphotransferase family protein [Chloroflexia bacterium]
MSKGVLVGRGRTADIYAWGDTSVLKLFHADRSASTVEYEAKIARAVHASGAASPALIDAVVVEGRQGLIYERVYGPSLAGVLRSKPWRLPRLTRTFALLHASMHRRTAPDLPSQRDRLTWKIEVADPLPANLKEAALQSLSRLPNGDILCHGDFHPENVIMSPRGPVVIDWIDATRGNPLADVARTSLLLATAHLHLPSSISSIAARLLITTLRNLYLTHYLRATRTSRAQIEAWRLPVTAARLEEGIAEEEAWLLEAAEDAARTTDDRQ